ncbi:hypothetical protein OSTOST_01959 [Ostertagia ostertagi]
MYVCYCATTKTNPQESSHYESTTSPTLVKNGRNITPEITKFYTESHHQCWNTQSCTGETCRGITTSTNIYEFSHYAKNNPGYTYCSPSCKCLCAIHFVYEGDMQLPRRKHKQALEQRSPTTTTQRKRRSHPSTRKQHPSQNTQADPVHPIQISIHGLSIFTKRVKNECRVDMGSLTGCYSCFQGAHVQVSCTSTLSEETAEIHCKNQTQIVKCSPHGIISDTVFHFATSSLDINCSVLCPAGQSTIHLQGTLDYVNEPVFQFSSLQHLETYRATSTDSSNIPQTLISSHLNQKVTLISFPGWESLRAYFDANSRVWRSRGRTDNSSLSFDANNPIILPRRTWITELYILYHIWNITILELHKRSQCYDSESGYRKAELSGHTISRPLSLLYPLEIPPTKQSSSDSSTSKSENESNKEHRRRITTRSHPMMTRSLARQLSTSFAILLICFTVPTSSNFYVVPDTKCTESHSSRQIIHADQCSSNGIAIAITTTLSNRRTMFGQLQCTSEETVEKFSSCQFSPATCQCNPLVYEATCNCPAGNISKHLNNAHQQLPLSGKDVVILQRGNSIQAKTTSGSSTSIQISIHGLSIFTKRVKNECRVDMGSLTGCYSCFQGAHVQVSCTSTLSEETAEIHCKNQTQIVKCSPHGIISDTVFHFTTSSLDINCSVLCPAGQSTIHLQGTLDYVNEPVFQFSSLQHLETYRATSTGFSWKDFTTPILEWVTSFTKHI